MKSCSQTKKTGVLYGAHICFSHSQSVTGSLLCVRSYAQTPGTHKAHNIALEKLLPNRYKITSIDNEPLYRVNENIN